MRFLLLFACIALSSCQSVFFYPAEEIVWTPDPRRYVTDEILVPVQEDAYLRIWKIALRRASQSVAEENPVTSGERDEVLFFHGNAENVSTHTQGMMWLVDQGAVLYAVEYRGYGGVPGRPTIESAKEDVRTALSWFVSQPGLKSVEGEGHDSVRRTVVGQSIGAALVLSALSDATDSRSNPVEFIDTLVLDSGFSSYRRIARDRLREGLGWIGILISYVASDCCPPVEGAESELPGRVVIIHANDDPIVPISHAETLVSAARKGRSADVTFLRGQIGGHITLSHDAELQAKVLKLIRKE